MTAMTRAVYVVTRNRPLTDLANALDGFNSEIESIIRMEVQIEHCKRRIASLSALHPKDKAKFRVSRKEIAAKVAERLAE